MFHSFLRRPVTHRSIYAIAVTSLTVTLGVTTIVRARAASTPAPADIEFAQQVSDLMLNELVAALFTEFDETTPENVEHGKQAISLIFNDLNRNMRLIGRFGPLLGGSNDRPTAGFEATALQRALTGQPSTAVQKINDTWYYRRSVPLSNTFHANCVLCHTNFTPEFFQATNNPGQWVGALVLAVPINREQDEQ
jgi:hypothetical protein